MGGCVTVEEGLESLFVNYDSSLAEAIKEGAYDRKNDDIIEVNFKNADHENGGVMLKVRLFRFGSDMMLLENVVKEMDKEGYRPATLRELLAFGAKNPDEQRKHPIVGLGSIMVQGDDHHLVPCLDFFGSLRYLLLFWWKRDLLCYNPRFLAVHKS